MSSKANELSLDLSFSGQHAKDQTPVISYCTGSVSIHLITLCFETTDLSLGTVVICFVNYVILNHLF